jgi:hypothetical protein
VLKNAAIHLENSAMWTDRMIIAEAAKITMAGRGFRGEKSRRKWREIFDELGAIGARKEPTGAPWAFGDGYQIQVLFVDLGAEVVALKNFRIHTA